MKQIAFAARLREATRERAGDAVDRRVSGALAFSTQVIDISQDLPVLRGAPVKSPMRRHTDTDFGRL